MDRDFLHLVAAGLRVAAPAAGIADLRHRGLSRGNRELKQTLDGAVLYDRIGHDLMP